jgi:hypothetical protein
VNVSSPTERPSGWDNFEKKISKIQTQISGMVLRRGAKQTTILNSLSCLTFAKRPIESQSVFSRLSHHFPTLGRAAPLRLSPRASEQRHPDIFALRYVRRSEFGSAFRGTAEMHARAASAESNAIDPISDMGCASQHSRMMAQRIVSRRIVSLVAQ